MLKIGKGEVASVPSLETCEKGINDHSVESQIVDGGGPFVSLATLS